jgi:predicted secreted protein
MRCHKTEAIVLALVMVAAVGGEELTLTEKDGGRRIETTVGSVLTLKLPATPGSGYSWVIDQLDAQRTKELGPSAFEPISRKPGTSMGGPALQVFRFEAREVGRSKLVLHYRRPWEKTVPPLKTFTVELDVR